MTHQTKIAALDDQHWSKSNAKSKEIEKISNLSMLEVLGGIWNEY